MLLESAGSGGGQSFFFDEPVRWIEIHALEEIPAAFAAIEQAGAEGFWVAGYLGYECGYHWEPTVAPGFRPTAGIPLAVFGVYREPVKPVADAAVAACCGLVDVGLSLSREEFGDQFEKVQAWISAGDTYQVNLTCCVQTTYAQDADALFAHMMQTQPVEFGAMLNLGEHTVLSASPELFFERHGRELRLRPMKGTCRRGSDAQEDERLATALAADEKNRAENVMIVDLLRSDVGRIAETGSVRVHDLFHVERHPSLLQMTSTVEATLREETSYYELFRALFPCGSIVGAPKVRTMQIIRELEARDRGVYTGAIGYIAPSGDAVFSVGIRTALLEAGRLSMGVGAGITVGSEAESEYDECLLKGAFLRDRSFELLESMRWDADGCALLDLHMERMEQSAKSFGFGFDEQRVRRLIAEFTNRLPAEKVWKLRLAMKASGECAVTKSEVVESASPLVARIWGEPVQRLDGWLRHKTTRRGLYDRVHEVAVRAGCVDALFVNEEGMVTEGAIHSVLVRHGDVWRTPPLSAGILPGVYRRHLLATRKEIVERDVRADELWTADEVHLMNAVRGLRRVQMQQGELAMEGPVAMDESQVVR